MFVLIVVTSFTIGMVENCSCNKSSGTRNLLGDGELPSQKELEATIEGARTLRENILQCLGYILQIPRLDLAMKEEIAIEDLYNGFKTNAISTLDVIVDMVEDTESSNEEQFQGLLNRLSVTVATKYVCAVETLKKALDTHKIDFDTLFTENNVLLQRVPNIKKDWIMSKWFSRISDSLTKSSCNRNELFFVQIFDAIKRKMLELNMKTFTNLLSNIPYIYMPPDMTEIFNHIGIALQKHTLMPDTFMPEKVENYPDIYSLIRDILLRISENLRTTNPPLFHAIQQLLPFISSTGTEVSGQVIGEEEKPEPDIDELFHICTTSFFPSDVIKACTIILQAFSTKVIKISQNDLRSIMYKEMDKINALIVVLRRVSLVLPSTHEFQPAISSLIVHLTVHKCVNKGTVFAPRHMGEILALLDAFKSLSLSSTSVHVLDEVQNIVLTSDVDWGTILISFPFHAFIYPRALFIGILEYVIEKYSSSFDPEHICHFTVFVNQFKEYSQEHVRNSNSRRSIGSNQMRPDASLCMFKCLPGVTIGALIETRMIDKPPVPLTPEGTLKSPNFWSDEKSELSELDVSESSITKAYKVDPDDLLKVLRADAPLRFVKYIRKYLSTPDALKVLERFNYKGYQKSGELLKELLHFLQKSMSEDAILMKSVGGILPYVQVDGSGDREVELFTVYLNTSYKEQNEDLRDMLMKTDIDTLDRKEKLVLENILKYFKKLTVGSGKRFFGRLISKKVQMVKNAIKCPRCILSPWSSACKDCLHPPVRTISPPTQNPISSGIPLQDRTTRRPRTRPPVIPTTRPPSPPPERSTISPSSRQKQLPQLTCKTFSSTIWTISGVEIDILGTLRRIQIPVKLRSEMELVNRWFETTSMNIEEELHNLNVEKYRTKGELLRAILLELSQSSSVEHSIRQILKHLSQNIPNDGAGGEPVDKMQRAMTNSSESDIYGGSTTTMAVDVTQLFQSIQSSAPNEIYHKQKNAVLKYIEGNMKPAISFLSNYNFDKFKTQGTLLKDLLLHLSRDSTVPEKIQEACLKILDFVDITRDGFPFVSYSDTTIN